MLGASACTCYHFILKVAEYREEIARDQNHFLDNKVILYDLTGTGKPKWILVDQLLVEAFRLLDKDIME